MVQTVLQYNNSLIFLNTFEHHNLPSIIKTVILKIFVMALKKKKIHNLNAIETYNLKTTDLCQLLALIDICEKEKKKSLMVQTALPYNSLIF